MRIALGTVQWGLDYGISNIKGIPSDKELRLILSKADQNDISVFDTSSIYGNSEIRLGDNYSNKRKIVTKVGELNGDSLKTSLLRSLKRLKSSNIYGYLFHKPEILLNNNYLWEDMKMLKLSGMTKKIGYSVYEPNELEILINKKMIPDIVQIPYSLLDRKFESYLNFLKEKKVEIHVRSIFLQGLYFKKISELGEKFKSLRAAFEELDLIKAKYGFSILDLALGFVKMNKAIDRIIIGVETQEQLCSILNSYSSNLPLKVFEDIRKIKIKDIFILNPVNW